MLRSSIVIFIILLLSSCAKNPEEAMSHAIDVALTHLSNGECDEALTVLEEVSDQDANPVYLQVLASAYACKAGFSEVEFIADDLTDMQTNSLSDVFRSFSILRLSTETSPESDNYSNILLGINTILNSSGGVPSQTARTASFGVRKAGDLGVQALILSIVNLGKFLHFYGNVDVTGAKGEGLAGNACFINYTYAEAQAVIGNGTGACVGVSDGHADLDPSTVAGKRRMCQGLMTLTNIIEILDNIDLTNSSSLSKLEEIATVVLDLRTTLTDEGLGTLINMTSQAECETYLETPSQLEEMELVFALTFEIGLQ